MSRRLAGGVPGATGRGAPDNFTRPAGYASRRRGRPGSERRTEPARRFARRDEAEPPRRFSAPPGRHALSDLCDVHNHLLPAVDDGCTSLAETLHYLRAFQAQGVEALVFTPHVLAADLRPHEIDWTLELHRARFEEVLDAVRVEDAVPRLGLGQEILVRSSTDVEPLVHRPDVGLGEAGALLVEFGFSRPYDADGVIRRVLAEGREVVVAHPERYRHWTRDPVSEIAGWRALGARLQVNGGSPVGLYSTSARVIALELLAEGLVDLVSSDHHGDSRPHSVEETHAELVELLGPEGVEELMGSGPRRVSSTRATVP